MTRPRPLALALPLLLLAVATLQTPPPWGWLWVVVPLLGAATFLGNLHSSRWGAWAPLAVAVALLVSGLAFTLWGWLCLGGVAAASLLGLGHAARRGIETRLWGLLPLVALVALFPFSGHYEGTVAASVKAIERSGEEAYETYRSIGMEGAALGALSERIESATRLMVTLAERFLPAILFVWGMLLVALAVLLARRSCVAIGRPLERNASFALFRLPEGAVWILLAALGAIATRRPELVTLGLNLGISVALGYCLQGLAVLDFVRRERGIRTAIFWVLLVFVVFFALPVLLIVTAALGLADVWLDLRRSHNRRGPEELQA